MQQRTYKSDYEKKKILFFETFPKFMIIGRGNDLTVMAMCCLTIAFRVIIILFEKLKAVSKNL